MPNFQEIRPRNESTKRAKDAAIKLHKLSKNIERKSKNETSRYLKEHIEDFNNNVEILQTALQDIKSFQADLHFGFEPITRKGSFGRRKSSFKIKRKLKPTTRTSIEDNSQDVEPSTKCQSSDYIEDRKGRTREDHDREVSYLNNELDKMRYKSLQDQLNDQENVIGEASQSLKRSQSLGNKGTTDLKRQLSDCRQRLMDERTEKDKIKAELDDALTRLSAIASSKLRDNNPNVVDLSDQNRPSKIAEQLSEMYDNEWTVAYEVLEDNLSEKECIAALLKILLDVYNECNQLATEGFYERVQQSIESPFPTKIKSVGTEVKLSDYLKQQIKELRKYRAKFAIEGITEVVAPKVQGDKVKDTDIQAYICKCINICWYMVVQDPPLVFSCGSSGEFDTNVFRSYTRRGPYVDYVVWPALLVSDGSMLSKGIAQGCKAVSSTDV